MIQAEGSTMAPRRVLLTGATGFVGRHVLPALAAGGWQVRCLTRAAGPARARRPELEWVQGDVADAAACARALEGCAAAIYLVHGMGEGVGFHPREVEAARTFARAAGAAGIGRVVYLGGVAPAALRAGTSEHLRSRLDVGEALRAGPATTIELRASMIVGHGSLSWLIVRDLAARLPVMVLPAWLASRTEPVAIDDVVVAIVRALDVAVPGSRSFDLPGPGVLSGRQILDETARVMGLRPARKIQLPLLTPRLSSLWVRFVTRARWSVAREVVVGLTQDLLARDDAFWSLIEHPRRQPFRDAAARALQEEAGEQPVAGGWAALERLRRLASPRTPT
jgi:uncharacterized protein YbjT (DUF2867 family)